jgi:hypothetical protein
MSSGSGLFSGMLARAAHLAKPGSELYDLRKDIAAALSALAAETVEEIVTPAPQGIPAWSGAAADSLLTATAVATAGHTYPSDGAFTAASVTQLALTPSVLSFTPAGATPYTAAAITGTDPLGVAQTETVTLSTVAITYTAKIWKTVTAVVLSGATTGGGVTESIGIGVMPLLGVATIATTLETYTPSVGLNPAALTQLAKWPRVLSFVTGGTYASAPTSATVTGTDQFGHAATEVVTLNKTNATAVPTTKKYKTISSIVLSADAAGTNATITVGLALGYVLPATAMVTRKVTFLGTHDTPSTSADPSITYYGGVLVQEDLSNYPRPLVFTTSDGAGASANVPPTVRIDGLDVNGLPVHETLTLSASNSGTATTVFSYARLSSLAFAAATNASAPNVAVTIAPAIGLRKPVKARQGLTLFHRAIIGGVWLEHAALTGTMAPPVHVPSLTGTVDLTTLSAANFTTLNGQTLNIVMNGAATTVTFASPTTVANLLAQIHAAVPGLDIMLYLGKYLRLTASETIALAATSTAGTLLGFSTGSTTAPTAMPNGTYTPATPVDGLTSMVLYYEYDASLDLDTRVSA